MLKQSLLFFVIASLLSAQELPIKKGSQKYHENGALKRIKLTEPAHAGIPLHAPAVVL